MAIMDNGLLTAYEKHLKSRGRARLAFTEAKYFLAWFSAKDLPLTQLTPDLVGEYLRFRKAKGTRFVYLFNILVYLRRFLSYIQSRRMIQENPAEGVSPHWLDVPGGFQSYTGPLRKVFRSPALVAQYRLPFFAPHFEDYVDDLLQKGYARTVLYKILADILTFHRFLSKKRARNLMNVTPAFLDAFMRQKRAAFEREHSHPPDHDYMQTTASGIERFLAYAFARCGRSFRKLPKQSDGAALPNALIAQYLSFCSSHKGLKNTTLKDHRELLLCLRAFLKRRGIRQIDDVSLDDIDAFTQKLAGRMRAPALAARVSALRSFFRFLSMEGRVAEDFAKGLISPCRFSADRRPKYLLWPKIQELLDNIGRRGFVGKRDYAILILLACHGLRRREVANLKIADIDLGNSCFLLRERKNGKSERVPMLPAVKEALQDYLAVRPKYPYPELFLKAVAPVTPVGGSTISEVVGKYLRRRFGSLPFRGAAHLLRHSFAKLLLDRGAKLPEIGLLLGHKRLNSTLIYTRVATNDLREVAHNYAELL